MSGKSIWIDGSGAVFTNQTAKICVATESDHIIREIGFATNNVAEYSALLTAMKRPDAPRSTIYTDSQLVHGHLCRNWKVSAEHLAPLVSEAKSLMNALKIKLIWIPRKENKAGILLDRHNHRLKGEKSLEEMVYGRKL